ncbi:hypothetical protein [Haloarchaeobius sp. TZWWS8]|uniref:hypothetical protein n=1 Tax=Haloarchaeobius sp. TZWWS8 TaxID=3446121 RepID=UPI003EB8ECE0
MSSANHTAITVPETARRFVFQHSVVYLLPDAHDTVRDAQVGYVERDIDHPDSYEKIAVSPQTIPALERAAAWNDTVPRWQTAAWVRDEQTRGDRQI